MSKFQPKGFGLLGLIIVLAVITAGGYWLWGNTATAPSTLGVGSPDFVYELEDLGINCLYPQAIDNINYCDASLILVDGNRKRTVVVENITQLFRQSQNIDLKTKRTIESFYFPHQSQKLIFKAFTPDTSGCCTLYAFDVQSQTFKQLDHYYDPLLTPAAVSPNHSKMLEMNDDGSILYLVDVLSDTERVLLKLEDGETMIYDFSDYGGELVGDFKWLNDHTVEYGIYSEKDKLRDANDDTNYNRPLIEKRTVEINNL